METHESALHAAQAAQSAAVDSRELLRELQDLLAGQLQVARFEAYGLNMNTDPIEDVPDVDRAGGPVRSTAIINFDDTITVQVGWMGRSPRAASQALRVAPRRFVVAPWIVDRVEISADVALPAPPGAVQVAVVRFRAPQQFAAGAI